MNKFIPYLYLGLLLFSSFNVYAAIPIISQKSESNRTAIKPNSAIQENLIYHSSQKYSTPKSNLIQKQPQKHKKDFGFFGILAFAMGIMGIFPLAIVFGVIGLEKGRKLQGIAKAGLVLGILFALILLVSFIILLAVL